MTCHDEHEGEQEQEVIVAFEDVDDAHPVGREGDFLLAFTRRDFKRRGVRAQDGRVRAAVQEFDPKQHVGLHT
jgi:hypothetical protein